MKIRVSFVSNSSSSSYIIYNWFDLPEERRDFIKDYDINALNVWRNKGVKYVTYHDEYCYSDDYPFFGKEICFDYEDEDNKENKLKYNFGFLNNDCRHHFDEDEEDNVCYVTCSMNNFDMTKWLRFNKVAFSDLEEDYIED